MSQLPPEHAMFLADFVLSKKIYFLNAGLQAFQAAWELLVLFTSCSFPFLSLNPVKKKKSIYRSKLDNDTRFFSFKI